MLDFWGVISWVVPMPRIPVTTRIIIFLGGDSQKKPSCATVTGRGDNPTNKQYQTWVNDGTSIEMSKFFLGSEHPQTEILNHHLSEKSQKAL